MKIGLNAILILLIIGLIYVLVGEIKEPIEFEDNKEIRKEKVIQRLLQVRQAQELYRDVTGEFAPNFDLLDSVMRVGEMAIVRVNGDPDDPAFDIKNLSYDTTFVSAMDSIKAKGINLDSLRFVPYGGGHVFNMDADTITYQLTKTHVVEAGTQWKYFMGKYADPKYQKYDNQYDPNAWLKFGSMNSPSLSGNWR